MADVFLILVAYAAGVLLGYIWGQRNTERNIEPCSRIHWVPPPMPQPKTPDPVLPNEAGKRPPGAARIDGSMRAGEHGSDDEHN